MFIILPFDSWYIREEQWAFVVGIQIFVEWTDGKKVFLEKYCKQILTEEWPQDRWSAGQTLMFKKGWLWYVNLTTLPSK